MDGRDRRVQDGRRSFSHPKNESPSRSRPCISRLRLHRKRRKRASDQSVDVEQRHHVQTSGRRVTATDSPQRSRADAERLATRELARSSAARSCPKCVEHERHVGSTPE